MREGPQLPPPIINDQTLILLNFEGLVLLSPSKITWELCEFIISIIQGIDWYKVPVVGINGKLYETIEVSALWSKSMKNSIRYLSYQVFQLSWVQSMVQHFPVRGGVVHYSEAHIGCYLWRSRRLLPNPVSEPLPTAQSEWWSSLQQSHSHCCKLRFEQICQ